MAGNIGNLNFGFLNRGNRDRLAQAIYERGASNNPAQTESDNLGNIYSERVKAILQQLSQYVDGDMAQIFRGNIVDTTKAQKAHQFFVQTNAQLDAADIKADFQSAMAYLNMVT